MASDRFVVITSINGPHPRLSEFLDLDYSVVVVGDSKTDDAAWRHLDSRVTYLSLEDQDRAFPALSRALGSGTYARKNLGYLWAIREGAKVIWETDDDTFPRKEVGDPLVYLGESPHWQLASEEVTSWNPYTFYAQGSGMWPRGYDTRHIARDRHREWSTLPDAFTDSWPRVLQMLVNREPDVDAMYRLTVSSGESDFPPSTDVIHLNQSVRTPGNTQATVWTDPSIFEYLYVPRWISFRFSDIAKMYVVQAVAPLTYAGFLMEQVRNPHDLMVDMVQEFPVYEYAPQVVDLTYVLQPQTVSDAYTALAQLGICGPQDVETSRIFSEEVHALLAR